MRRLTVAASAALCLMGTSSLALAEEGTKYGNQMETGKLSQEPSVLGNKREPVRPNDAMAMKGEKKEHKEKTKAHKETAKTAPAAPAPAP